MLERLLKNIDNLNAKDAEELIEKLNQYPYCQSLQMMYAMALANMHSTQLNQQVQRAAIAMPDRLKLCQMVSNGEFEWINLLNEIERNESKRAKDDANDFMLIERYLDNVGEVPLESLAFNIEAANALDDIEDYAFPDEDLPESDEQDALIDSFIEAEKKGELFVPKVPILPDDDFDADDADSLKKIREKAFLSESLAKIYVKQHKFEQAIAIFSALNLRYSKKYTYFADQIRYLKTILSYQRGEEDKTENN